MNAHACKYACLHARENEAARKENKTLHYFSFPLLFMKKKENCNSYQNNVSFFLSKSLIQFWEINVLNGLMLQEYKKISRINLIKLNLNEENYWYYLGTVVWLSKQ